MNALEIPYTCGLCHGDVSDGLYVLVRFPDGTRAMCDSCADKADEGPDHDADATVESEWRR